MKHLNFLLLAITLCTPSTYSNELTWPQGQQAAVSLSYDDALNTQLDNAIPVLNQHQVRASFYLTMASPVVAARLDEWRAAAQQGHELGNHTIYHACSKSQPGTDWVLPYNDLDKRVVQQVRDEIRVANGYLKAIDGQTQRTMAPPCGHTDARDGNYLPAIADDFVAIKGAEVGYPPGFIVYLLPDGHSGQQLVDYVKQSAKQGGVVNIIFHGVGGDHLSVSVAAHRELVEYLARHKAIYWTDTYQNIMSHLQRQPARQSKLPEKAQ
ncbi:polysaccharide deacetylase family protein [Simiduia agarivorans]|uniref:Polysaccharide deacetylase n=1 Tax=Simiduia agarivorans (strain DSM 21679 / JCM 13881 / BCRC 17597 / SA1) TaxID=1117647 RepID=K4KNP1_SIMAS|nr:polysaccharide deacetylase family protein [Simiduia agarivorans]AFV00785.1 polysaccharide deacetylase [Simiduia agarivorans SA1 = DSM 21679]